MLHLPHNRGECDLQSFRMNEAHNTYNLVVTMKSCEFPTTQRRRPYNRTERIAPLQRLSCYAAASGIHSPKRCPRVKQS